MYCGISDFWTKSDLYALNKNIKVSVETDIKPFRIGKQQSFIYRPYPKDGDGNIFSLFVSSHPGVGIPQLHPVILPLVPCSFQGVPHLHPNLFYFSTSTGPMFFQGGGSAPFQSHNTGPMSFPGGTPSPSHNTSTGPMSFPWEYPSDWAQVPSQGVPQSWMGPGQDGGTRDGIPPGQVRMWVPWDAVPSSQGWGSPKPGQDREVLRDGQGWGTTPPPPRLPGIGQQVEYLIRRGRYASSVHVGRLSCYQEC